jgi:hypothetical protein
MEENYKNFLLKHREKLYGLKRRLMGTTKRKIM